MDYPGRKSWPVFKGGRIGVIPSPEKAVQRRPTGSDVFFGSGCWPRGPGLGPLGQWGEWGSEHVPLELPVGVD